MMLLFLLLSRLACYRPNKYLTTVYSSKDVTDRYWYLLSAYAIVICFSEANPAEILNF